MDLSNSIIIQSLKTIMKIFQHMKKGKDNGSFPFERRYFILGVANNILFAVTSGGSYILIITTDTVKVCPNIL